MEENSNKTEQKQEDKYYWTIPNRFKKGQSGNLKGRPKGSKSIKDAIRQYLQRHPTEFTEFVEHFIKDNRELAWQMLEGKPPQDITSGGEKIVQIPIYGGLSNIQKYQCDQKDIPTSEENKGS